MAVCEGAAAPVSPRLKDQRRLRRHRAGAARAVAERGRDDEPARAAAAHAEQARVPAGQHLQGSLRAGSERGSAASQQARHLPAPEEVSRRCLGSV